MSLIDRRFRLSDDAGGLGLSCEYSGLNLAGAPLLRTAALGLAPRPIGDIAALINAAYGPGAEAANLSPGLALVAVALDAGASRYPCS